MRYVFICGASRSGTTLLARCLGRHAAVHSTPELHLFNLVIPYLRGKRILCEANLLYALQEIYKIGFLEFKSRVRTLDWPSDRSDRKPGIDLVSAALNQFFAQKLCERHEIVVEQTGMNLYHVDEISAAISSPKFIVVKRDIRAILASQRYRFRLLRNDGAAISKTDYFRLLVAGGYLMQLLVFRKTAKEICSVNSRSDAILFVYENFVQDPKGQLSKLCEFLGINFHEELLEVGLEGSSHRVKSRSLGVRKVISDEPYRSQIGPTATWLAQRLYPDFVNHREDVIPTARGFFLILCEFIICAPIAVVLSVKSYGSVMLAVRTRLLSNKSREL